MGLCCLWARSVAEQAPLLRHLRMLIDPQTSECYTRPDKSPLQASAYFARATKGLVECEIRVVARTYRGPALPSREFECPPRPMSAFPQIQAHCEIEFGHPDGRRTCLRALERICRDVYTNPSLELPSPKDPFVRSRPRGGSRRSRDR